METQEQGFRLVPLDCPTCGAAVAAEGDDVLFYCTACRNGYRFLVDESRLEPVEVAFLADAAVAADLYLPFWFLDADVTIDRQAAGWRASGLLDLLRGRSGSAAGPRPLRIAVPAFHTPVATAVALTERYTADLPAMGERLGERLVGGKYGLDDARKLARFALIAAEVRKPDLLRDLEYRVEFGDSRLLGVPFVRRRGSLSDAVFGIPTPKLDG